LPNAFLSDYRPTLPPSKTASSLSLSPEADVPKEGADVSPTREKVRPPSNRRQVVRPPPLVLIVENDDDTREMYSESLIFSGVRVIESLDAGDAFQKAHIHAPDLITTDLGLPGGTDGCQLTSQLKTTRAPKTFQSSR
jgi:PleD family two-component response regulator